VERVHWKDAVGLKRCQQKPRIERTDGADTLRLMPPSHLAHCQLGYRPASPKSLTLVPDPVAATGLPERIPFYLRALLDRIPRDQAPPPAWNTRFFNWPFDLARGALQPERGRIAFTGELRRTETRWGLFWQGEFTTFAREGNWQIETDHGSTYPITIKADLYDRIQRGYVHYLSCQRSGCDVPVSAARSISTTASSTPRDSKSPPPAAGMMPATCGNGFS